ncbi:MAG: MGMT family protein [Bacteroidales bacterium]|nr:MGMT family protein [Bacteroidales bacterium]
METDRKWVIVRIDGKIAAISTDYRMLAEISARIASEGQGKKAGKDRKSPLYDKITAETVPFGQVWDLRSKIAWDDFILFGTDFQKKVWRKLWELTHGGLSDTSQETEEDMKLICYSDFAGLCENKAGVRAVAHAIGLNPISVIIPCHLVIPKESIDKINEIKRKAEATIFKGDDLCLKSILDDSSIDFGEYALGKKLKRELIKMEHA